MTFSSKKQALQLVGSPIQAVEFSGERGDSLFFIRLTKVPNSRNKWRYVRTLLMPAEEWALAQAMDEYEEEDYYDNEGLTHT
jgi:hypothetical protein